MNESDRQYIIDVLIHASLALDASSGLFASDLPDMKHVWQLDHSKESRLIEGALRRLGVDVTESLPVREISIDTDLRCEHGNSAPSTEQP